MFIKGVNLGNWLVLEKWMSPHLFDGTDAEDEYYLPRQLSKEVYEARILIHRSEYITERDFAKIKHMGLTHVRIPVPYFIFGDREPFIGCIKELDQAFAWAEKYDLKIEEFTQAYIDEMGEGAYFSGTRRTYEIPENGGPITDEIPMSEDGSKKLMVTISEEAFGDKNAMTMFDVKDLSLLMYITRRAAKTMESTSVSIPLSELARVISNSGKATNPSQRYYTEAEQRLFRVTETTFKKIDDKTGRQTAAINFLGSAIRKEHGGVAYMDITLGPVISDAILNDKIRRTPAIDYERVTSRTGKIMLMALQRERIKAFGRYLRGAGQCVTIFTYSDFLSMVNFGTKVKHRNWKLIKETLINDFKENNLYIEDVVFDNVMTTATVYWLLLSEHEQQDLAYYGYGEVIDEQTV